MWLFGQQLIVQPPDVVELRRPPRQRAAKHRAVRDIRYNDQQRHIGATLGLAPEDTRDLCEWPVKAGTCCDGAPIRPLNASAHRSSAVARKGRCASQACARTATMQTWPVNARTGVNPLHTLRVRDIAWGQARETKKTSAPTRCMIRGDGDRRDGEMPASDSTRARGKLQDRAKLSHGMPPTAKVSGSTCEAAPN